MMVLVYVCIRGKYGSDFRCFWSDAYDANQFARGPNECVWVVPGTLCDDEEE